MTNKNTKGRRNVPLYITMPPGELDRLRAFADKVGRPMTWVIRDALGAYLTTVEGDAVTLAQLTAPKVDPDAIGKTKPTRLGRPRGFGTNIR